MANKQYNPVGWFEIYIQDMDRARKFYEEVFQVKLEDMADPTGAEGGDMKMVAFPMVYDGEAPGAGGALVQMEGFQSGGNSTIVYFSSFDGAVEAARVEAAGGRIFSPKSAIGEHGFIVLFYDPDGNMVGIHSMN
jgi:predicted enzyme related to lactoylglutathione lyase